MTSSGRRRPALPARRRIVGRHAKEFDCPLDPVSRERLEYLPVASAFIVSALRAAHLDGGTAADRIGEVAVASTISIPWGDDEKAVPAPLPQPAPFDLSLSFADIVPAALDDRGVAVSPGALWLCSPACRGSAEARELVPVRPGDVAATVRKAKVLQVTDPEALRGMLRAEIETKLGARPGSIEFT